MYTCLLLICVILTKCQGPRIMNTVSDTCNYSKFRLFSNDKVIFTTLSIMRNILVHWFVSFSFVDLSNRCLQCGNYSFRKRSNLRHFLFIFTLLLLLTVAYFWGKSFSKFSHKISRCVLRVITCNYYVSINWTIKLLEKLK